MINRVWWVIFLCLMLLSACNGNSSQPMLEPESIYPPTSSPIEKTPLPTSTFQPTSTPTLIQEPGLFQNCLTIQTGLPENQSYTGKIVFESLEPGSDHSTSFYDFSTGETTEIEGSRYAYASVSPDRSMLALSNLHDDRLEIRSSNGQIIQSLARAKDWGSIAEWQDNQHILITGNKPLEDTPNFVEYPRSTIVLNPFTGEVRTIPPDYPYIDHASRMSSWGQYGTTVYDFTMTRVVYPGDMKVGEYEGMGYILYDTARGEKLAQLPSRTWHSLPVWNADGSHFLVFGDLEFHLVGTDGEVSTLTRLNPAFKPGMGMELLRSEYYAVSPDHRLAALWLYSVRTNTNRLAILDLRTGIVTDTCLPGGFDPDDIRTLPYPVWSPDGRSVAVSANFRPEDGGKDVVLVDLERWAGYAIETNRTPVGWMVEK